MYLFYYLINIIIIVIKLSFIACLNKKNFAQKRVAGESKARITKTELNAASSQSGAILLYEVLLGGL